MMQAERKYGPACTGIKCVTLWFLQAFPPIFWSSSDSTCTQLSNVNCHLNEYSHYIFFIITYLQITHKSSLKVLAVYCSITNQRCNLKQFTSLCESVFSNSLCAQVLLLPENFPCHPHLRACFYLLVLFFFLIALVTP